MRIINTGDQCMIDWSFWCTDVLCSDWSWRWR